MRWERISTPDNRLVDQVYSPTSDANDLVIPGPLSRDDPQDEPDDSDAPPQPAHERRGFPHPDQPDEHRDQLAVPRSWIRSRDGGANWKIAAKAPAPAPRKLDLNGDVFEATSDGLYRTRNGKREKITKDLEAPYPRDLF